ncbi:MAG: hypothetical protein WCR01_13290 [Bacteroidota bacterium]
MNDQADCTAKISEATAVEIKRDVAEIQALAFALICSLENEVHGDNMKEIIDEHSEVRGSGWIRFDNKAMLRVFGQAFYEKFLGLGNYLDSLKKFRDID